MRQIKFRAWHPTQGMAKTPILSRNDFSGEVYCKGYTKDGADCLISLMQFTGLKDKNGVEIYEGDLIKNTVGRTCKVVWHEAAGCWDALFISDEINLKRDKDKGFKSSQWYLHVQVIGNSYENPELLEVK